jgi:hypothetical protein
VEAQTILNVGTEIAICLMKRKGQLIWRLLAKLTWSMQGKEVSDLYSVM